MHWTVTDAVLYYISKCLFEGVECGPHGRKTYELLNVQFSVVSPTDGPVVSLDPDHNARMAKYLEAEKHLYNSGERRASEYAKHAKLWAEIANPDGTINSAYGWLIQRNLSAGGGIWTQWQWAAAQLAGDWDTRQAVVHVNLPEHQRSGNRDFPCTMHLWFAVRSMRLNLTAVMRSCDVTRGLPYDMPYFVSLQKRMLSELRQHRVGLELGTYTHVAHSLHLYDSEVPKAKRMTGVK